MTGGLLPVLAEAAPASGVSVSPRTAVLLVVATGLGVWGFMVWWRLMLANRRLHHHQDELENQLGDLRGKVRDATERSGESAEYLRLQKEKTEVLRKRSRTLEQILAMSVRINSTRNMAELLDKIVLGVEEIIGFRKVILHLWSEETRAFEARAFAGIHEKNKAALIGIQVSDEEFRELTHVRYRFSNSYLIRSGGGPAELANGDGLMPPAVSRKWCDDLLLIAPLISPAGEVRGYLSLDEPRSGLIPGVVEIRQLEFLVQQAATAIESTEVYDHLAANNTELALASEKLASLNDMKANFVANVSHELRTPLTSISAYTELLQQNRESMSEEARGEFLKVINAESAKLTGIINDLLELNAINNGTGQVKRVETDMVDMVRRLETSWHSRALERNIRLHLDVGSEDIKLQIDALLFQQLLGHLLSNAFKFTPEGGHVTLRLEETGTAVRLTVEDSGIGIPDDKLGAIFEQFYQVDGSATREHNGQGVGLAICHEIVTHHDGRIWAENIEPQGARFTVLLPRRPSVLQTKTPIEAVGEPFAAGEFIQRLMHWISESLGVEVATLMMPGPNREHLRIRAAIGLPEAVVQSTKVRKGAGIAGKVWITGRTLLIEDLTSDNRFDRETNEPRYTTPSLLCVPLHDGEEFVGVISVNNRLDQRPLDQDDCLFLESLAPRLAYLLTRYRRWRQESRDFQRIRETLRATTAVGHLRHESLMEVCQEICLATARKIMLPADEMEHLAFALQYYDVGLSRVPPQLLNKPGPLDEDEERFVQKHVAASLEILDPLQPNSKVRQLILHHHENFDGTGYPAELAGESIPLGSRLVRLTDTLSALLSPRPWRPAFTLDQAMAEIRAGSGQSFCPRMTDLFLAETALRRNRIGELQRHNDDGQVLLRPALDRRGMVTLRD